MYWSYPSLIYAFKAASNLRALLGSGLEIVLFREILLLRMY